VRNSCRNEKKTEKENQKAGGGRANPNSVVHAIRAHAIGRSARVTISDHDVLLLSVMVSSFILFICHLSVPPPIPSFPQKDNTSMAGYFYLYQITVLILFHAAIGYAFSNSRLVGRQESTQHHTSHTWLFLQTNVQLPLLDLLDDDTEYGKSIITPLPSSHLAAELATPFLYGMQLERPLEKLLMEEATNMIRNINQDNNNTDESRPMYGHLVWKDKLSDSLIGAIGCTAEILVNAPTTEALQLVMIPGEEGASPPSETPPSTVLCRGGYRFVVKQVVKTIPYPVVIVDEIVDDADENDSDMFAMVSDTTTTTATTTTTTTTDDDDDDEYDDQYSNMKPEKLIQRVMVGVQEFVTQKVEDANSKEISLLEKSIMEDGGMMGVDPTSIAQYQAEEMAAVWDVFQSSLLDDIAPQDRRFAIAIMAAELAEFNNQARQKVLMTRDALDRLRMAATELDEIVGMARARKVATQITDKADKDDRDLKVGNPQLPPWAKNIGKGTRIEYYWNGEFDWVAGEVIEDPVTIMDELLITVLFDDGEVHQLPLRGEDKARWRPE
jgi:hypothetical protein